MRITRVTKIRGHRVFRDFAWPKDLHGFGQFNLIYGWNGCGKTTLSSLFAHLEKGTNLTEGEVEFEIDDDRKCAGTTIAGTNLPPVRVFNRPFIDATITAAGERVEPIYYLGEDSIEKQSKADELKTKRGAALAELTKATSAKETADGELDRFCSARAKVIKEILTGSQSPQYNNYDKRRFKQSMAAMQTEADAQAARLTDEAKEQLRKQKGAQPKGDLPAVACNPPDFEKLSNGAETLLERSVASETIDALAQDKTVARWVQDGLALHSGAQETSTCRFCSQPLTTARRAALEGHFNDAFAAFQQEMASEISSLDRALADLKGITFPDSARAYDHLQVELATATSEVKDTGYSLTRAGKPVSHLSEGERTAIAFLYFLKSLQDRAFDLANGVVVIDDPVSSLDANALFSAFGYMKERTKACGQLFVLTHNFAFFREVRNWFQFLPDQRKKPERRPARFFLLGASGSSDGERTARLGSLDPLLENYESEYHYLFRRIYDETKRTDGESSLEHHYSMPNIARRLLESFLAFRYPDCSGGLQKRLERVEFLGDRKMRILSFLNTYSHTAGIGVVEHDPSLLAETRPVLSEVLEMIKSVDPIHYAGMEQLVNGKEASA